MMKTFERIRSVFLEHTGNEVCADMQLIDNLEKLQINSITAIKIIVSLEDEFDIIFDNSNLDLQKFNTLGDLTDYISLLMKKREHGD